MRVAVIAILATLGCGDPGDDGIVTPDAGELLDGGEVTTELRLRFEADPSRGDFDADFDPTLTDIEILLSNVRAIGDSAPGDERTTIENLTLSFVESDSQVVQFDAAPVGRYSRVRARVDSFVTRGELTIGAELLNWEIDVQAPGGLELDISLAPVDLEPGQQAQIDLAVELDKPYDEVDWDSFDTSGGTLRVDDSYREIDSVREKILDAFDGEDKS